MKRKPERLALLAVAFGLWSASAYAQTAATLLVDPAWLAAHLSDRDLVILHVGRKPEYDAEHIRGARLISDADVTVSVGGGMYDLPPYGDLRSKLASFGISDGSRIVVYFGKDTPVQSATRIVFTLDYAGLGDRTSLLNGGLAAWKRAGQAVTSDASPRTAGTLTARPAKNVVADAELVKSVGRRPGYVLVDARAPVFYTGIEASMGKSGHIPGAINIPFSSVTDTTLTIDRDRVADLFQKAGVKSGDTIVAYCHIGQQATAVVFAARLLGHPVLLYDGSMHDWAMNNRGPVEK